MTEEIKRILDTLTENYDDIGSSYYPEDLFNHKEPKILYDYIIQLQKENKELHNKIDKLEEDLKHLWNIVNNNDITCTPNEMDVFDKWYEKFRGEGNE